MSELDNRDLSTGRQLGDERPTRIEGRLERPIIRPPDYVPPQGEGGPSVPSVPMVPNSQPTSWGPEDGTLYRAPLGPTMGPDTLTGEEQPYNPDDGPRELGYATPPATYGDAGDAPGVPPYQPTNGPAQVAPEPESPLKPLYDLGGRVVGYVQDTLGQAPRVAERALERAAGPLSAAATAAQESYNDPLWQTAPAPVRAIQLVREAFSKYGRAAATQLAKELGVSDEALFEIFGQPISGQDIASFAGETLLDPTNYTPAPAAPAIARAAGPVAAAVLDPAGAALGAAGRGIRRAGTRVTDALAENAENVARADARRAAEGSTATTGTFGQSWDDFSRLIDSDAQRAAREAASQRPPRPTADQLIREEYGRPWEEVPLDPKTAAMAEESGSIARPRNQVSPDDAANLTGPVEQFPNMEGRMNATLGASPSIGTRLATDVGSSLGSGTMGAAVGAGLPAETDEERRRNALMGAAIGMVGGPLASRAMRRGEGALATPGVSPGTGPRRFTNPADALQAAQQAIGTPNPRGVTAGLDKMEAVRRWLVRNLTDNRVDLAELQKEAQRTLGRPLTWDEMVLEQSRVNPTGAAKVMIDDVIGPAVREVGEDRQSLSALMRLLNNADVATATGNPNRTFSGGLTGADSQAAAAHLWSTLSPEQQRALDQSSDQLYQMVGHYRDEMVRAGVWTQELADDLAQKYPHWVPTKILDYMNDPASVTTGTRGISLRDRGLRAYTIDGTAKAAEDPLASLVRYVQDAEAIIQKNETFNAFVNLRDRVPGWDTMIREVSSSTPAAVGRGEKTVTGFVNGERRTFIVPAPMAAAIQMEQGQQVPVLRQMTQLFKELITRTPLFVAGQVPLDAFAYGVRETAREGGPLAAPKVAAELVKGYAEAFRGLLDGTYKGDAARYLKEGGGMAGFYERAADAAGKTIDDITRRSMFEVRSAQDAQKLTGWLLTGGWVQAVGQRVELAPRIASFRLGEQRAVRAGASAEKAALQGVIGGRDVTLDFQRGGAASKVVNQIVPFFNVGMQSATSLPRMLRENPTGTVTTLLGLVAAPTIAAEAWNRSDPQMSADYDDVPDYVKDRGIVIMLPGAAGRDERGERRPNYALVPLRELAPVAILARDLSTRVLGGTGRSVTESAQAMLGAASPIQASSGADLFSSFNPAGLNTALQYYADRDFFRGGPIATERRDEQASSLAQGAADLTGMRPSQTDFIIRDLFGGTGAMASAASNLVTGKAKDEQRVQNTPIVGGLLSRFVGDAVGGNLHRAQESMRTPAIKRAAREAGLRDDQITPVASDIRDMPITRAEQARVQREYTRLLEQGAQEAMADPEWKTMTQPERERWLRNIASAARREASATVIEGWDDATLEQRTDKRAEKRTGVK